MQQQTIKQSVSVTGIGLHSGKKITLTIKPAPANSGIHFVRVDLPDPVTIKADPFNVQETVLCTGLSNEQGVKIMTIEHLFAAIAGLSLDNLIIEVDADEIPVMDGSSSPFIFLLESAGTQTQNALKKYIKIKKKVRVELEDKWIELYPYQGFKIDYEIDFNHPEIARSKQRLHFDFSSENFIHEISRARTFGFLSDVEKLRAHNLAQGASMENAIVLDERKVMNQDGLRYQDEFVRHKALDAIGDLYVSGYAILGELRAYKAGHAINNMLLRTVLSNAENWEFVTFEETQEHSSEVGALAFSS
tara:strand:+ start:15806 stop:16717 length:912 start_codon:yes stop_codon:yes gene_type:complete